ISITDDPDFADQAIRINQALRSINARRSACACESAGHSVDRIVHPLAILVKRQMTTAMRINKFVAFVLSLVLFAGCGGKSGEKSSTGDKSSDVGKPPADGVQEIKELATFDGHRNGNSIWSLAFSPDSKHLVSASSDSTLILWDMAAKKMKTRLWG